MKNKISFAGLPDPKPDDDPYWDDSEPFGPAEINPEYEKLSPEEKYVHDRLGGGEFYDCPPHMQVVMMRELLVEQQYSINTLTTMVQNAEHDMNDRAMDWSAREAGLMLEVKELKTMVEGLMERKRVRIRIPKK